MLYVCNVECYYVCFNSFCLVFRFSNVSEMRLHIRCHHSHQPIYHHRHSLLTMPSCHSSDHALKGTFHDLHQLAFLKLRNLRQ